MCVWVRTGYMIITSRLKSMFFEKLSSLWVTFGDPRLEFLFKNILAFEVNSALLSSQNGFFPRFPHRTFVHSIQFQPSEPKLSDIFDLKIPMFRDKDTYTGEFR